MHASISALPVELLGYIFDLSVHSASFSDEDEHLGNDYPFDPANMMTTLCLSSVSRYWRNVTMNTPSLWTDVCISTELPEDDDEESLQMRNAMKPNARRITTYLTRSGNSPIDILISARDTKWDFLSMDAHYLEDAPYTHPFLSTQMHAAMDLLLPHAPRWRSLTILSDTCSPIYTALNRLSAFDPSSPYGAPFLEKIVLKRCNEYIGSYPEFMPREMKGTPDIPFAGLLDRTGGEFLPSLRELKLHGVHINWANLPPIIPASFGGLYSLELSEHAYEVRPSLVDFRRILATSPNLRALVVGVSGPTWDQDDALTEEASNARPIPLPLLSELTLKYTDAEDARHVLLHVDAPNAASLHISDVTPVAFPEQEDASSLLATCGTSSWGNHARFPALREVTMDRIEACSATPFRTCFEGLPKLERLSLEHTSGHAINALRPREYVGPEMELVEITPCPNLHSVSIRGAVLDFNGIARTRDARIESGARPFEPELTLDNWCPGDIVPVGLCGFEVPGAQAQVRICSGESYQEGGIDDVEMEDLRMEEMMMFSKELAPCSFLTGALGVSNWVL
ncbi:hypothetical protein FIBSPDRAFT_731897 [Athelia psychrophila]|uniref:Uncharacterized protein n=1 Tax=Athelia psychrophila TaxID=1759441 RepID=A0A166Q727_9AGAM|nr:hypothetical protein FIBSPDRAFT_731897 [Fibularhizoctonia sp. CBS 109695]